MLYIYIYVYIYIYTFYNFFTQNLINKIRTLPFSQDEKQSIESKGKPMCLVCLETISVMKDFNLSRHYYNCTEHNASCCT